MKLRPPIPNREAVAWLERQYSDMFGPDSSPLQWQRSGSVHIAPMIKLKSDDAKQCTDETCTCYVYPAMPMSIEWTDAEEQSWLHDKVGSPLDKPMFFAFYRRHAMWAFERAKQIRAEALKKHGFTTPRILQQQYAALYYHIENMEGDLGDGLDQLVQDDGRSRSGGEFQAAHP